jgi:hypothetical protein
VWNRVGPIGGALTWLAERPSVGCLLREEELIRNRASGLVALMLIAAGVVVGCGGSDSSSKQGFADKADKVCSDTRARVTTLSKSNPRSRAELLRYIDQLKVTANDGVKRLKALDPPSGDAGKTARQFTDTLERQYQEEVVPALDQLHQAVVDRDKKALKVASKKLNAVDDTESNRLATELGAKECAQT